MKYILCLIFVLSVTGCAKKAGRKIYEIKKIELGRSGAWADFGATISIDSALQYQYFGDFNGVKQGYFAGKASTRLWDSLNKKLELINYKIIDTTNHKHCNDCNYYEMIIYFRDKKRRIVRINYGEPDIALNVFKWLDTTYKNLRLKQVNYPLQFETTIHRPLPEFPIHTILFPPPHK